MKTKSEIIEEIAASYTSKNRSVMAVWNDDGEEDTECRYFGPNGKRCAFSRCCLETDEVINFLAQEENIAADKVLEDAKKKGIEILKEEYRGHEYGFWTQLQCFHDKASNWDENGLTEKGVERKAFLLKFVSDYEV